MSATGGPLRWLAPALASAALGCAAAGLAPGQGGSAGRVPDTDLGLSKGSVFDVPAPPPVPVNASAPGERPAPPRAYPGAPPVIPHAVSGFLAITARENACVGCHRADAKEKRPGEATPLPPSHQVDPGEVPGPSGARASATRWVCTACHVERTGARPLVGNGFGR